MAAGFWHPSLSLKSKEGRAMKYEKFYQEQSRF
jgi:hypothetical protein